MTEKYTKEERKEIFKGRFDTANDTVNHTANKDHLDKLKELRQ